MSLAPISHTKADSRMSIPVFEGSMLSVRSNSRANTGIGLRYKSGTASSNLARAKSGKYEIRWKSGQLDAKYECSYCQSYLKFPVQFNECKHRVCSSCLTDILKQSSICPTCDLPIQRENIKIDHECQKEIQALYVFCINRQFGCTWEGTFKAFNIHNNDCSYSKNGITCEFCEANLSRDEELEHLNKCKKFKVPCPTGCGLNEIARENLKSHLENECSKNEISCPFVDCNCTFKSVRESMPSHLKESPGIHLNLMCKTITLQKKQMQIMTEIISEQKEQLLALSNRVSLIEKCNGSQIIWKIDGFMEKYNDCKIGKKPTVFSPQFLTGRYGYKLALSTSLYGDGKAKGKFTSLFVCICKGDYDNLLSWPFNHKITVTLLDQSENIENRNHVSYTIKPNACKENLPFLGKPITERNASFGAQKFVELDVLNSNDYIKDDTIFIKIEVDGQEMILI